MVEEPHRRDPIIDLELCNAATKGPWKPKESFVGGNKRIFLSRPDKDGVLFGSSWDPKWKSRTT